MELWEPFLPSMLCFPSHSKIKKIAFRMHYFMLLKETTLLYFFCSSSSRETDTHTVLIAAAKWRLIFEDLSLSLPFLYTDMSVRILCCRSALSEICVLFWKFCSAMDLLITFQRDWCRTGKNGNSCSFQVWVWIWYHGRPQSPKGVL